jgi:N-ethylmaleimide reductase
MGALKLSNRVVMAPMTRSRSPGNVPVPFVATYYAQRAEAGLIVTEGTSPSPNGVGYLNIPGIYSKAQVEAWRAVTSAVHQAGGHIFIQLMHTGRVTQQENLPAGAEVVAPSAVKLEGQTFTAKGMLDYTMPRAMTEKDIEHAIGEYVTASANAIEAGFDGMELHGANGYLIEQFLGANTNLRTDGWGGSVQGRQRFAVEVAKRVSERIGAGKVGIRLSPYGVASGMVPDAHTDELYLSLAKELSKLKLAYVHVVDHSSMGAPKPKPELFKGMREAFQGTFIIAGGMDAAKAEATIDAKSADLIGFGRPFISNPKLVTKLRTGAALRAYDPKTFYTPGEAGYTDYPAE